MTWKHVVNDLKVCKSSSFTSCWLQFAFHITGTVFLNIDERGLFGMIEESDYKNEFAEYLTKVGKLRNIVAYTVRKNRYVIGKLDSS